MEKDPAAVLVLEALLQAMNSDREISMTHSDRNSITLSKRSTGAKEESLFVLRFSGMGTNRFTIMSTRLPQVQELVAYAEEQIICGSKPN